MAMFSEDNVSFSGYVARSEMRYTPGGNAVLNFSVPIDRSYKKEGANDWVKRTLWYNAVVWGKYAETLNERIDKGVFVVVHGKLEADWETGGPTVYQKQDGSSGSKFEVTAKNVVVGPRREESGGGTHPAQDNSDRGYGSQEDDMAPPPDSNIPF